MCTADCHRKLGHVKAFSALRGWNFQILSNVIDEGALSRARERAGPPFSSAQIDKPSDDRSHFEGAHIPPLPYRGLSNVSLVATDIE